MANQLVRVGLTASFLERLDAIEAFVVEEDAGFAFNGMLAELAHRLVRYCPLPNRILAHLENSK